MRIVSIGDLVLDYYYENEKLFNHYGEYVNRVCCRMSGGCRHSGKNRN